MFSYVFFFLISNVSNWLPQIDKTKGVTLLLQQHSNLICVLGVKRKCLIFPKTCKKKNNKGKLNTIFVGHKSKTER